MQLNVRGRLNIVSLFQQGWHNVLILGTIFITAIFEPASSKLLEYDHTQISHGEWWRLFTGQLVHTNFNHTLLNAAGVVLLSLGFQLELKAKHDLFAFFFCMVCCGVGLFVFFPYIEWYKGLSGILHGYMIYYLFQSMRTDPSLSLIVLCLIIGKVIWEQTPFADLSNTESLINSRVATEIHLLGAISGFLFGITFYWVNRMKYFKNKVRHKILGDLEWAIPHLFAADASTFQQVNSRETTPSKLSPAQQVVLQDSFHQDRLGIYFEKLIASYIGHSTRYAPIADHVQLKSDQNQTIGELDFVVHDLLNEQYEHWEVATKFYLGVAPTNDIDNWLGPGLKDFLHRKWQRLNEHQLPLSNQPAAKDFLKSQQIQAITQKLLVKGRLFYPIEAYLSQSTISTPIEVSDEHLTGWWATPEQLYKLSYPYWAILKKHDWLGENNYQYSTEVLRRKQCLSIITKQFSGTSTSTAKAERPILVAGLQLIDGRYMECSRGFVVPKQWEQKARDAIKKHQSPSS
jgi:rhomboid family GlyGly-CTERM serine protease